VLKPNTHRHTQHVHTHTPHLRMHTHHIYTHCTHNQRQYQGTSRTR